VCRLSCARFSTENVPKFLFDVEAVPQNYDRRSVASLSCCEATFSDPRPIFPSFLTYFSGTLFALQNPGRTKWKTSLCTVACCSISRIIATVETVLLRICVAMKMLSTSRCIVTYTCRLVLLRDGPNRERSLFVFLLWSVTDIRNMWGFDFRRYQIL
jgi:hypothetical protein